MAEEEKKSGEKQPAHDRYEFLRLAVSGIVVFAALSYVLGRLRTEAYYSALGISPGLLSFRAEDYMFSSVNLVIICAIVSFALYVYYRATVTGRRMFLAFPLYEDPKNREERIKDIAFITGLIAYAVYVLVSFYSNRGPTIYIPGLIGVAVGIAVGVCINLWISWQRWTLGAKNPYSILAVGVLLIVIWLPSIAGTLAKIEAKVDAQTFAKAVLVCEDPLDPELQSSPQNPNESVQVKIVATNNDMTYVLKQDIDSGDEWQIYGIQSDSIKTVVFEKKSG